jgi:predicted nucleotidyltransferase
LDDIRGNLDDSLVRLPGTAQHQALLAAVLAHYKQDRRVQAVILFGSLVRGDWDAWSDLDLDVVVAGDYSINVMEELDALREPLAGAGERVALILPDGPQEGDVVLESLMRFSIRYHTLDQTSPNIVDSMLLLAGSLEPEAIVAAGHANRKPAATDASLMVDRFLYFGVIALTCLQRRQVWTTLEVLHRMRSLLMDLYARTHDAVRAYKMFDAQASRDLQSRLGTTLSRDDPASMRQALTSLLDMLEQDLDQWGNGQVQLTQEQAMILEKIRKADRNF